MSQGVTNYIPTAITFPTTIICREKGIKIPFLESKNLPESMFFGAEPWSDMILTDSKPFPDLNDTWNKATTEVQVMTHVSNGSGSK